MKLSFALLLWSLLLASGLAESAQEPTGKIPNKQKISATPEKDASQNQRHAGAPTAFEKSLLESLRAIADQQKADYEQRRADQKPWWIDPALLGVGFVYTVFAGFQWWAIHRQANIAKRAITHFERPWVRVDPKDPTLPNKELGFGTMIPWTATNVGKSSAFITRLFVDVKIFPTPTPPDQRPQYGDPPRIARFMLSPHGGQHSSEGRLSGTEPRPMSAGELRDMWSGETCLVFYGFVDYLDPVGTSHTTRFCAYWDHNFVFNPVGPDAWVEYT